MNDALVRPHLKNPLQPGWNSFLENDPDTEMEFGIFVLNAGESHTFHSESLECALLVLQGKGTIQVRNGETSFERTSWIEQNPWAVHAPRDTKVTFRADITVEIAVVRVANPDSFPLHVYLPDEVENDHRGQGILDDASYRIVRCVFDRRNAPEAAKLVLGEVVNFPGRWSSYPPHHHSQPELYYYRFEPSWGYGHGELGDTVYRLQHHDLLKITGSLDHAQVSAPGFHMYYLWTIRHPEGDPYLGFEFTPPFGDLLDSSS